MFSFNHVENSVLCYLFFSFWEQGVVGSNPATPTNKKWKASQITLM